MTISSYTYSERKRRFYLRKSYKFKSTNWIWNDLGLNRAWVIGYLTKLFKTKSFKSYKQWEDFYYQSGKERLENIHSLSSEKQGILKDFTIPSSNDYSDMYKVNKEEKDLNAYYGRTEKELLDIGSFMYQKIVEKGNSLKITEEECRDFVKIRVLDEIFIGIEREINTIKKLKRFFPYSTFKEVPVEKDAKYAVDYEVFVNNKLVLALQIKSNHYKKDNQKALQDIKKINKAKNEDYTKTFGVDVIYVYSKENGYIEDVKTLDAIHCHLSKVKS